MDICPNNFPYDTTEFRIGGSLFPWLCRWYARSKKRMDSMARTGKIFWPGFFLTFDFHLHLAIYAVSNLPHWPWFLSLRREQPVAQLAIRCPFFCLVLSYRAYDWTSFLSFRSEIAFYYSPVAGWRFVEGGVIFEKERRWRISEWFLQEEAIRQWKDMTYKKETKFVRVG